MTLQRLWACAVALWFFAAIPATAQFSGLPPTNVSLDDLEAFRPPTSNWRVVGDVMADRHEEHPLQTTPGTGVLANQPTDGANGHLFTNWTHGDIELELEFMMPRGSNSGIYLQGRYEIQLLDSWGVRRPAFSDCGGIYQRWDPGRPEGQRGYEGHPPRFNASRAPGLWQRIKIVFRAPRFNDAGEKTANATFVRVVHNGVVIHENVEVTGPTRAAAFDDEQPQGPLMIQGDHGPVAIRSLRYKRYGDEQIGLSDVRYRYVEGDFEELPSFAQRTPQQEETSAGLRGDVVERQNDFAVRFDGTLHAPRSGTYFFDLHLDWITGDPHFRDQQIGGGTLTIDGRPVIDHDGMRREAAGTIDLDAGSHPFTLAYFKNRDWHPPTMTLYAEGPAIPLRALNVPESRPTPSLPDPIHVTPDREPTLLRSFIMHDGTKRTHAMAVGDPVGIHYAIDLNQEALLHVWKGPFVDATSMWHDRGHDQLVTPRGSVITLSGAPAVAFLDRSNAPWPDSLQADVLAFRGYTLDEVGRPTFRYRLGDVELEDAIAPASDGRSLTRTLRFRAGHAPSDLWCRMAGGTHIEALQDGSYSIDDESYYLEVHEAGRVQPFLRTLNDRDELLVPISLEDGQATLRYSLIW